MRYFKILAIMITLAMIPAEVMAGYWRAEPMSPTDRHYIKNQVASINDLAGRHFGRQINGQKSNDIKIMQRLLDEKIVRSVDVQKLQAMGIILGILLQSEYGLKWIVYVDINGRSRSLQVPNFDKEFIFPTTQISRKAEVGIKVNVAEVYKILEQSITDIRNKPPF